MRLKVLQILEATGGGTARHVVDLCHGLVLRGVEVHLAYSPLRMDNILALALPELEKAGVRCLEVPMRRTPHPSDLRALFILNKYVRAFGHFDIIHGQSAKGGALARLLGMLTQGKIVYSPHGFVSFYPTNSGLLGRFYAFMESVLAPLTDAIVVVSKWQINEAAILHYTHNQIRLIPNGLDLHNDNVCSRLEVRKNLHIGLEQVTIGFVGRLAIPKSPLMLLEAFAQVAHNHPQARLVIVGDGPLRTELEARVNALGLADRVFLPGFIDGRWAMRGFDIFALPSEYEGFPYVLLEAMAEGLPIVATCVGGADQAIVDGENGFVVPVGDVIAFAGALDRLLSDEALRLSMGAQSRLRVKEFSVEKMVDATLALYRELAGR